MARDDWRERAFGMLSDAFGEDAGEAGDDGDDYILIHPEQYERYKALSRVAREWLQAKRRYRRFHDGGMQDLAEWEQRLEEAVQALD